MVKIIIACIVLFDYFIIKCAGSASRKEEKIYIEEFNKDID